MYRIMNYILYGAIWIITLMPLSVLFLISDVIFFVMYYVFPYRKNVVANNLRNAFPGKSKDERKKIQKSFYRYFVDFMIETIKMVNLSTKAHSKRVKLNNLEIFENQYSKGNNIVIVSGHYGNWEWVNILELYIEHRLMFTVKKQMNSFSNDIINKLRQKYGGEKVYMNDTYRTVYRKIKNGEKIALWLLADQRPPKRAEFWTTFLNQETAFFLGASKMVKKLGFSMVFMDIQRIGRGRYEVDFELLADKDTDLDEFGLTELHVRKLEQIIKGKPENWLWSHKRWKFKKPQ